MEIMFSDSSFTNETILFSQIISSKHLLVDIHRVCDIIGIQFNWRKEMDTGNEKSEVLVVSSKVKNYIKEKSGLNSSSAIMDVLTSKVKELCDRAIENAVNDKRKTVKDKDFQ